jgi:hypothetical protein
MSGYRFIVEDGAVAKVDVSTEAIVARLAPAGTRVVQLLPKGGNLIVREDYYHFPEGASNLYCLDHDLQLLWTAELPSATDVYANEVIDRGDALECASWDGFTCLLSPETGQILRKVFTK